MHAFLLWTHLLLALALAVPAEGPVWGAEGERAGCATDACCCETTPTGGPAASAPEEASCPCTAPAPAPVRVPEVAEVPSASVVPALPDRAPVTTVLQARDTARRAAASTRRPPDHGRARSSLCVWTL